MVIALILCLSWPYAATDHQAPDIAVINEPMNEVLKRLTATHQIPLVYAGTPPSLPVSASCQDCTVEQLLEALFAGSTVTWKRVGSHYLVQFDDVGMGVIHGRVSLRKSNEPLAGGVLLFLATEDASKVFRTMTTSGGNFASPEMPGGTYQILVKVEGFEAMDLGKVTLKPYQRQTLHFQTAMIALPTGKMIVTPGHYRLLGSEASLGHYRTKQELERMPHLGNDILRTLSALPGANRDGISARPRSHGGLEGDVQIQLDGMILRDPFHAKELGGAVSTIDRETVSALEWQSGGYTADYGNAMGGLISLQSKTPSKKGTVVGMSLTDIHGLNQGLFAGGRGHYFVSGRSGNLSPILEMIDLQEGSPDDGDNINSGFSDTFSKVHFVINPNHAIAAHLLLADDEVDYGQAFSVGESKYQDRALWVNLDSVWSDGVEAQTHISWTGYKDQRIGFNDSVLGSIDYADKRRIQSFRLGQNWHLQRNQFNFRVGWHAQKNEAMFNYRHKLDVEPGSVIGVLPETATNAEVEGEAYEAFFATRFKLHESLLVELGGRYDTQTWIRKDQWSPRMNVAWRWRPRTHLKLALGKFYQPRQLHQLQVEDGRSQFEPPASAKHYLMGLQHLWSNGLQSRVELFYKPITNPLVRFENLWSPNFLFDQLEADRIAIQPEASTVRGAEISFNWEGTQRTSWLLNYAWSEAWDQVDGVKRYRRFDQRHTVNLNFNYRLGRYWHGHLAWNYNSGWRTTAVGLETRDEGLQVVLGPIHGDRLPAQHRLDLRFNREAAGGKGFSWHIDIINAYNKDNIRGFDDIYIDATENLVFEPSTGLPLIISFGVNWRR